MTITIEVDRDLMRRELKFLAVERAQVRNESDGNVESQELLWVLTLNKVPTSELPHEMGHPWPETISGPYDSGSFFQKFLDAMWGAGMRPTGYGDTQLADSEARKVMERYLADMRQIAFANINVEAPAQTNRARNLEGRNGQS